MPSNPEPRPTKRPRVDDGTATHPETVRLRDEARHVSLQAGLTRPWHDGKFCDITIRVLTTLEDSTVETTEIKAHRVVLTAISEPLDRMICGPMASVDENNVLTLPGIDPAVLRSVVEYAYSGTLEFTQDTVWSVLEACTYLGLDGATELCTEFLCEQLTPANVLGVAKTAADFHYVELKAAALAFIKKHTTAVSEEAEWLEMPLEEAALLACETHPLLSRVVPHSRVLKALGQWMEFAPDERRGAFVQHMASESASAQCNLGICYEGGWGVAKDFGKAFDCYTEAAEQEFPRAHFYLGCCYEEGKGVPLDMNKAVELFTKAAGQGDAQGQCSLGFRYHEGQAWPGRGPAQDLGKAFEWYTKAAEQGHASAQFNLGLCYEHGWSVAPDLGKAFEWYTKAAEQGHANGQCHVGLCCKEGQGVAQDRGKALEWFIKALEQPQDEADWRHPEKLASVGRNCTRDREEMAVYVRAWITQQHAKQTSAELALVATTTAWRAVGWLWEAESARCLESEREPPAQRYRYKGYRKDIVATGVNVSQSTRAVVRLGLGWAPALLRL